MSSVRIKLRLFRYKIKSYFVSEKRFKKIKIKILEIHINNGDIDKAIKEVKFLYDHDEDPDWYFILKNLYP
ncbi:hypothetical protein C1N51_19325 [Vibrio campbellii]|nr:hypothetical protein C1N51_19325 [Vibrio campbellii]